MSVSESTCYPLRVQAEKLEAPGTRLVVAKTVGLRSFQGLDAGLEVVGLSASVSIGIPGC